ncbi:HbrB-like-domain-containing protein [Glomus cerebriforme]|uniref:HbrB-like-domain-containing protein n=1 Tax=Glomus cerebriforme TaxID=658196 RepID=A0A397T1P3_9GLOM|nr:HbrB-like-domain-containing protein [Glomus cerebriforme]
MSLNPINEIAESPRSTINSLSTSTTSSAASFSHHLRAPISTSLPSYSSSASTYVGPNSVSSERTERTTTETGTSNTPTSTDGLWNNSPQQQNQNQNLSFIPQIYRTTRATSFSSRNTSSSTSSSMTINNNAASLSPQMERSHSTSTMYSLSSTFHEKSLSGGSIPYTPSTSSISHHKMNLVYDTPVTSKELERLERMEQLGQQHDTWGSLVVKVLPLFNGEGLKLCIEDLNELVRRCINDRPTQLLYEDINELLESGMFTLNGKLRGVPDEKLVSRLVELWSFYFGTVIPYFEGVFLPLQIHNSTTQQNHLSIRRLVLMSFRDHVILPMGNRVEDAFNKLFHDFDSGIPVTDTATRMLQMSYILSSVLSDDDKQRDMDRILGKLKNNWKLFMRRRDRRGFVGMSPSNSNSSNSNNGSTSSLKSTPQDPILSITTDNFVKNSTDSTDSMKISNHISGFSSATSL